MEMDDAAPLAMLKLDRLERDDRRRRRCDRLETVRMGRRRFRQDPLRSEGEHARGEFDHADAEMLWDHAVASFWDTQLGVRHDFGVGPDRNWAAFGVQGLAPYWFGIEATAYVGDAGRTALRLEIDYDLSLTQRLILQPRLELNAYGKADPAAHIGCGTIGRGVRPASALRDSPRDRAVHRHRACATLRRDGIVGRKAKAWMPARRDGSWAFGFGIEAPREATKPVRRFVTSASNSSRFLSGIPPRGASVSGARRSRCPVSGAFPYLHRAQKPL